MEKSNIVRLKGLMNVEVVETGSRVKAQYHSSDHKEARKKEATFIHWIPEGIGIEANVMMPDASMARGLVEPSCMGLKVDDVIQFERFGFVRVDNMKPFVAYFAHR